MKIGPPKLGPIPVVCFYLGWLYTAWGAWAYFLAHNPDRDSTGIIRASVRLIVWILPLLLIRRVDPQRPLFSELRLDCRFARGIGIGLLGFVVLVLLAAVKSHAALLRVRLPRDLALWLNPIITAPLAEELAFRGFVFRTLRDRFGVKFALPISALAFALIHLPYWLMAGEMSGGAIAIEFGVMLLFGAGFAVLFQWSGSLWSPLVCHWLNNLLMISLPH